MTLRTKLTEMLGIRHPVLLAPMGGTAGGALAGAVSVAGGLGMIGGGNSKFVGVDWLEREFAAAGNRRVGCGFITWSLAQQPDLLDLALRHKPAALMLSFGDAEPFLPRIKAAGIPAICQVQSLAQARQVLQQGADIIVAQGAEAGGHGARRATLPLVPAVVDMVAAKGRDVPVVAAGGIADGRGLAAALMLGAAGVLMELAFTRPKSCLSRRRRSGGSSRVPAMTRCALGYLTSHWATAGHRNTPLAPSSTASPRHGADKRRRWLQTPQPLPVTSRRAWPVILIQPPSMPARGSI